jgi:tetratricopeptide (TPR) repeat protein
MQTQLTARARPVQSLREILHRFVGAETRFAAWKHEVSNMMIPLLASLCLVGQFPAPAKPWQDAIKSSAVAEKSPLVRKILKAWEHPKPVTPDATGTSIAKRAAAQTNAAVAMVPGSIIAWNPTDTPEGNAQMAAYLQRVQAESDRCVAMESHGNYAAAKQRLELDLETDPSESFALPLLDMELLHGDFVDAYKVSAGMINRQTSQDLLFRASLAASSLGNVYPGQREFCLNCMLPDEAREQQAEIASGGHLHGIRGEELSILPAGYGPDSVSALSALAIGNGLAFRESWKNAVEFYEWSLRLDPNNPLACLGLSGCYTSDGYQYSKAVQILQLGLERVPKGGHFERVMASEMRLYQADFKKVGDGKPAYRENIRPPANQPRP